MNDRLSICMVSDFFYPNMGGVENHIYNLSQALKKRGHKVVVVTHSYGDRVGVHWLSDFLKVYHLPLPILHSQCTWTALWAPSLIWMRNIMHREAINHIHAHQAHSSLCHDSIMLGRILGIPITFTDHSLFNFDDVSSIVTNKLLRITLAPPAITVICVSHTGKENTCLRAHIPPKRVTVIPNAVVSSSFQPLGCCPVDEFGDSFTKSDNNNCTKSTKSNININNSCTKSNININNNNEGNIDIYNDINNESKKITIVVLSRLVYRKGADLLVKLIPPLLGRNPSLNIIIAGEGPKRVDLEQMRDQCSLHGRLQMVGPLKSGKECREHLVKGDLFLNTSLTEAFCISILEAASCGLLVVSTDVGGIKEVLPPEMIILSKKVSVSSLIEAVEEGLRRLEEVAAAASMSDDHHQRLKWKNHKILSLSYNWHKVAERTEEVYLQSKHTDIPTERAWFSWLHLQPLIEEYSKTGRVMGYLAVMVVVLEMIILYILDLLRPPHEMDVCLHIDGRGVCASLGGGGDVKKNPQKSATTTTSNNNNKNRQQPQPAITTISAAENEIAKHQQF